MKSVAILTMLPMVAFCSGIGSLPQGEFADTEVSTNLPVAIDFSEMSRLAFRLSFDASPTNGVEVSIGEDAETCVGEW